MESTDEIVIGFADGRTPLRRPTREELGAAVRERVTERDPFLVVGRPHAGDGLFVQAYRHGPDDWQVEYRHGSAATHHQAVDNQSWRATEQVLWSWIAAEPGWRDQLAWFPLDLPARQVPVAYEPHFRTRWIGVHDGGQFFGDVTGASGLAGWAVVLHRFDADGNHLGSDIREFPDGEEAEHELARMLGALPGVVHGPIVIRPFEVRALGLRWGLIDGAREDGREHYELEPQQLGFGVPFDGLYDT
ncbi:hypothetical protein AB0K51_11500 [Kitasatospora sp. NPDC049285]|uniref:hypothetical protein n=1 Tax=Kitasatospora sp. NPDC049285 TaxID=3157096 RepID=UPI00343688BB